MKQVNAAKKPSFKSAPSGSPKVGVASPIEKIYSQEIAEKKKFQTINRPAEPKFKFKFKLSENTIKIIVISLAVLLVAGIVWAFFFRTRAAKNIPVAAEQKWYSVKLVNGETFYGQIADTAADPVVMKNVYYDYDQIKKKDGTATESPSTNLRLVKRGKETYGPDGTAEIVRAQVLYMEQLKEDSKVLQAILGYEKYK